MTKQEFKSKTQSFYRDITQEEYQQLATESWKLLNTVQQEEVYNKVFNKK